MSHICAGCGEETDGGVFCSLCLWDLLEAEGYDREDDSINLEDFDMAPECFCDPEQGHDCIYFS